MKYLWLICMLVASVTVGAETEAPAWTARYWASSNSFEGTLRVKLSGDSHLIYTNGVSTGVLTKDVNQADVTAFREGMYPVITLRLRLLPTGELIPCSTNLVLGTTNFPIKSICVSAESLHIGKEHIKINDDGVLELPQIVVRSPGLVSKGNGKWKHADIETEDPDYGLISSVSNATYGSSKWKWAVNQTGEEDAAPILVKVNPLEVPLGSAPLGASPHNPAIEAERQRRKTKRDDAISQIKANPNSVPALRAVVRLLMEEKGWDLD